eukprot:10965214-Ditylum_brightwellii.AAC.1
MMTVKVTMRMKKITILVSLVKAHQLKQNRCRRSLETHCMKNKPISEGCKFFCLETKKGYIINFTPGGRTVAKLQQKEYKEDKKLGKIESMIIHVLSVIKKIEIKQGQRKSKTASTRSTS